LFSDAVLFCNWLSRSAALEPCYVRTGAKETAKGFQPTGQTKEIEFEVWQWRTGKDGYRLPTEAEWEWACRAGSATAYAFGNNASLLPDYGVFRDMHTQPGASRLPNAWGLFDMHGNIMEWCWDRFASYPETELVDPSGPDSGSERVLRGGYYAAPAAQCSSAWRVGATSPAVRAPIYGFRVVRDAPKTDN